jgi:glycosyltransferase involved in cell wall biosynthesis
MNIAHVVCTFPPYFGGMGGVTFHMASALAARGHAVEVITPMYGGKPPAHDVSFAKRLEPSMEYGNAARLPEIRSELDAFDLVHLHYPFFGTANLVRKWKLRNPEKPLVVTYHMDTRSPGWKGLVFSAYNKWWMPKILSSADLIYGSSLDYIQHSDARHHAEAHPDIWKALPFGVDAHRFAPMEYPEALAKRYELDPQLPTVVFVGGMDPAHHFKGISVLLKALTHLAAGDFPVQAVLVGDGSLRAQYMQEATALGIGQYVKFAGRVHDDELPAHYALGTLTVLPSIHQGEAFGMVLLESMSMGNPVLASDLPGVRTVAAHAGATFPVGDARGLADRMAEFFSMNESDQHAYRVRARMAAVDTFQWPVIAAQLESDYQALLDAVSS